MWQVRSIATQRRTVRKRRRVATNLWVGDDPDEGTADAITENWVKYLGQLRLYLLSLAMAAAVKIDPAPAEAESSTTDSTKYVLRCHHEVPVQGQRASA